MSDASLPSAGPDGMRRDLRGRLLHLAASRPFQAWAARSPLTRRRVRREGEALMDLVAGFVHAQALRALVAADVLPAAMDAPVTAEAVAARLRCPAHRAAMLLDAGVACGVLARAGTGWRTSLRGAAMLGAPGLVEMVRHHDVLYRDLADPLAVLRGEGTELARFWPYVLGGGAGADEAARYSDLMARTQGLVAEETLAAVSLRGVRHLMDVGGGTGAFLRAAARPGLALTLFDLPEVVARARAPGARIVAGSFRDDPLPAGADAISLVRVLYDHDDPSVAALLAKCRAALPPRGRLIVSEPMTGGARPTRAGTYFGFYCAAMGTGRARSAEEVGALLRAAGFARVRRPRVGRGFVTSVLVAHR